MDNEIEQRIRAKYKKRLLALGAEELAEIIINADEKLKDIKEVPESKHRSCNTYLSGIVDARAILLQLTIDAMNRNGIE